jgi:hypothetical protein
VFVDEIHQLICVTTVIAAGRPQADQKV